MEQKMVTIPFDVDLAKKIQSGEHSGKIVTNGGEDVRIVCWDRSTDDAYVIVGLIVFGKYEHTEYFKTNGISYRQHSNVSDLVLQVPEWAQFKDGDILACEVDNGGGDYCKWYSILNGKVDFMVSNICFRSYVSYDYDSANITGKLTYDELPDNIDTIRLATEEEKQKFIKRLQEENTDKAKYILKRFFGIEEKQEQKSEFLQPVLVRVNPNYQWLYGNFTHMSGELHFVSGGIGYKYCIPYNEQTKHLLGTTDDWEE